MANNIDDGTSKVIWRDSARELRFLGINYVAVFPLVFWMLHANKFTLIFAVLVIAVLAILERFKYSPIVVFRLMRCYVGGKVRHVKNWNEMKRYYR